MQCALSLAAAAAVAVVSSTAFAQTPAPDSLPPGWRFGIDPASYEGATDRVVRHSGEASARIRSRSGATDEFGTILQAIRADAYRGQRVRLSAWVKTQEARAQLWMRVDGLNATLDFDNMDDRPLTGTNDWTRCDIVLDVPADALGIVFGLILIRGTAWLDDVDLSVVPGATPHTGANRGAHEHGPVSAAEADSIRARNARRPAAPRNPGFEERP